jgi:hypothetical protein
MLVGCGWRSLDDLADRITGGALSSFGVLLERVSDSSGSLPPRVRDVHFDVTAAVEAGDPTPFKRFRRTEFQETVKRMSQAEDAGDVEAVLASHITVTKEVRKIALEWRSSGALLFGLSDKPDEASIPTENLAAQGYLPLHRTPALVVGEA